MSGILATAAVTARLETVVGPTAKVYNMLGNPTTEAAFKDRFLAANRIHCYEVTREASVPDETKSISAITRNEDVVIYGYFGFQDGVSEPIFQAEVDAICAAFDPPSARTFGADSGVEWSDAPRVEGPKMGRLGQVLVHYVRIIVRCTFDPIF